MIIKPRKKDKYHRNIELSNPKWVKAGKWDRKFAKDDKGFYLIKIENGYIMAGRVKDGKMLEVVYGGNAEDIYYELIKRKLISKLDTAAYLGRELTRAEYCLKNKKRYIQE